MSGLKLSKVFNQESWDISQGSPSEVNSSLTVFVSFFFFQLKETGLYREYINTEKLCNF